MKLPFLPEAASTLGARVDTLFAAVALVTGAVALAVVALLVVFALRYRRGNRADRRRAPEAVRLRTERRLEIAWIAVPMLLFSAAFAWAAALYFDHAAPPQGALEIAVVAKSTSCMFPSVFR